MSVGQPGKRARGTFDVKASIDTGPILGLVEDVVEVRID